MRKQTFKSGFTLIELLVVISIIGLLSSVVLASVNAARSKARDASRVEALIQLRTALELYYSKHGSYPVAGINMYQSDLDSQGYFNGTNSGNWIPGLVADGDISSLPHDPHAGVNISCDPSWWGLESPTYVYQSYDGKGYALASICGAENNISINSIFFDKWLGLQDGNQDLRTMKICNQAVTDPNSDECNGGVNGYF
jgi:prepilin-type N-terminal cleavage/methylation domain-containing protein